MGQIYLSSYEYSDFDIPRKLDIISEKKINGRSVFVCIVDRPIFGQDYGLGGIDIDTVYLIGRFDELTMNTTYPTEVHVFIAKNLNKANHADIDNLDELQNIAWASIYDNEIDAKNHKI